VRLYLEAGAAGVIAVDLAADLEASLADVASERLRTVTGSIQGC
jgi:hypothetical protein